MAEGRRRRRAAPRSALIGPLVMLASGAAVGVMIWRFLMLEPEPPATVRSAVPARLSRHDRQGLERLLQGWGARP